VLTNQDGSAFSASKAQTLIAAEKDASGNLQLLSWQKAGELTRMVTEQQTKQITEQQTKQVTETVTDYVTEQVTDYISKTLYRLVSVFTPGTSRRARRLGLGTTTTKQVPYTVQEAVTRTVEKPVEREVTRNVTVDVTRDVTVDVQKEVTETVEAGFLVQSFDANGKAIDAGTRLEKAGQATYDAELLFNLDLNNDSAQILASDEIKVSSADITGENLLIDSVSGYQLGSGNDAVGLKDHSGQAISSETSQNWDALVATESSSGYQILMQGERDHAGQYNLWQASTDGVVQGSSGWKSSTQAAEAGWEEAFSVDLNGNKEVDRF